MHNDYKQCEVRVPSTHVILLLFLFVMSFQIALSSLTYHHESFYWAIALNQIVIIFFPCIIVARRLRLNKNVVFPLKEPSAKMIFKTIAIMFAVTIAIDYVQAGTELVIAPPRELKDSFAKLMEIRGVTEFIIKILFLCFLPAICEEVFFRGFCQTGLVYRYGSRVGITITAAIFALAHGDPWHIHLYFLLGFILGWLFYASGTLWIPIIAHLINNLRAFADYFGDIHFPIKQLDALGNASILIFCLVIAVYFIRHFSDVPTTIRK
jgi:membrane protease YdiL (CAAX protease family)